MKLDKFLEASPLFWIYAAHSEVFKRFQSELNKENLTFIQSLILVGVFFEETGVTPSSLVKSLRVTPSVVSHALGALVAEGLLLRRQVEGDARKNHFKATSSGKRKVEKLIKVFDSFQNHLEKDIGVRRLVTWNKRAKQMIDSSHDYFN